ncbi:MAG TPA: hypothetical protein VGL26_05040 [Jatrophihabitans sp.]|jgi:hypothetical protein
METNVRTEDDLRAAFAEPVGVGSAERELIDRFTTGDPVSRRASTTGGRRTGYIITTGIVGAAAATVAGVVIAAGHDPSSVPGQAGTQGPATQTSSADSSSAVPSATASDHPVPITPQSVSFMLEGMLPPGGTVTKRTGRSLDGFAAAELVWNDGHGAAEIAIGISYRPAVVTPHNPGPSAPCGGTYLPPTCKTLADGTQVAVAQGKEYPYGQHAINATDWDVVVFRTDGVQVDINEWNAPQEKDAAVTRPEPPLSVDQLTAIAKDQAWQPTVDANFAAAHAGLFTPDAMP